MSWVQGDLYSLVKMGSYEKNPESGKPKTSGKIHIVKPKSGRWMVHKHRMFQPPLGWVLGYIVTCQLSRVYEEMCGSSKVFHFWPRVEPYKSKSSVRVLMVRCFCFCFAFCVLRAYARSSGTTVSTIRERNPASIHCFFFISPLAMVTYILVINILPNINSSTRNGTLNPPVSSLSVVKTCPFIAHATLSEVKNCQTQWWSSAWV